MFWTNSGHSTPSITFAASKSPFQAGRITGAFSCVLIGVKKWTEGAGTQKWVLQFPGSYDLRYNDSASNFWNSRVNGSDTETLVVPGGITEDEWFVLGISYDPAGNHDVFYVSETETTVLSASKSATGGNPATTSAAFGIGKFSAANAFEGMYGLLAIFPHTISASDVQAWFDSRDFLYGLQTSAGSFTGEGGASWFMGHAIMAACGRDEGTPSIDAGVGVAAANGNVIAFEANAGAAPTEVYQARACTVAGTWTLESPFQGTYSGFWTPPAVVLPTDPLPGTSNANGNFTAAESPLARQIAEGSPSSQIRAMILGRSWAIGEELSSAPRKSNYAEALVEERLSDIVGVYGQVNNQIRTRAGFDCSAGLPFSTMGASLNRPTGNFEKLLPWTSTASLSAAGGIMVPPSSKFAYGITELAGSKILNAQPVDVAFYLVRFPGATNTSYRSAKATTQSLEGTLGTLTPVSLDTTVEIYTGTGSDTVDATDPDKFVLQLSSDPGWVDVNAGDLIVNKTTEVCLEIIEYLGFTGSTYDVECERPAGAVSMPIALNDEIVVGPWEFLEVKVSHAADVVNVFRKVQVETDSPGCGCLIALSLGYRPDEAGIVVGSMGQAATYDDQLDSQFPSAPAKWLAMVEADVVFQTLAQGAEATTTGQPRMLAQIESGLPAAEVVWLGQGPLPHAGNSKGFRSEDRLDLTPLSGDFDHTYILSNGAANGIPVASCLLAADVGYSTEQALDARLEDGTAHGTKTGYERLWENWLALLTEAALPGGGAARNRSRSRARFSDPTSYLG